MRENPHLFLSLKKGEEKGYGELTL